MEGLLFCLSLKLIIDYIGPLIMRTLVMECSWDRNMNSKIINDVTFYKTTQQCQLLNY